MTYFAIGPFTWGKGETIHSAVMNARRNWPRTGYGPFKKEKLSIYEVEDKEAYVTKLGGISYQKGTKCEKIQTSSLAHTHTRDDGD